MTALRTTPGQTIGPYLGQGLPFPGDNQLVPFGTPGAIRLHGHVYAGDGSVIPDALVEIWQADADGNVAQEAGSFARDGWTFTGWGRTACDRTGEFSFTTVLPGATGEGKAPFFAVVVFARGLLDKLFTRIYLPGHPANAADPLLASLDEGERSTLIARADETGLRFDIHLQGASETVFLRHG
ncbi:MAG TPA: protocatechuate 3,4-dioxygenase subunit alpha [Nocardioides sp.]|nr:protocatechuate 3,4-dioxygenase subunit alpha [Nocardioides sp.]